MRTWPIRRKLLAIPVLAVLLLTVTALWMARASSRYEDAVRSAMAEVLLEPGQAITPADRSALHWAQSAAADALDQADDTFRSDRLLIYLCLFTVVMSVLVAAWQRANAMAERIAGLRESLSQLLDRGATPVPEEPAGGDEIEHLSNRLHKAVFRGRERETQLKRSSEFLEFAQAAGGFGVFDLDLFTGQVTGTPLFFELLGIKNHEALFTRDEWLATIHPEDLENVIQQLNAAIGTAGSFQAAYRSLQLDARPRWLAGRGQVIRDAEGFPARAIGTITDITERKEIEESLRNATESLDIALSVAGVATMDLDFAAHQYIVSTNFLALLGVPAGTPLGDVEARIQAVHPEDLERVREAVYGTARGNAYYRCDYRVVLADGGVRWIDETASTTLDAEGALTRITGSLVDVTDRKLAEQASIDAKHAAEAANQAKSNFLANVSHEIRTPMNGVIGMSQMLSETELDPSQREYVDIIRGSAQALLSLINDVLDLSKIEAGRLELECVPYDLPAVVYETVGALALQSAVKGIELLVAMSDMPFLQRGDPGRVRQIILNLVGNAIKFTHEGHIVVRTTAFEENGVSMLRLEVEDTGIGIPSDRLDRLFSTFTQIDASTTRHYGGTGLGLSIVKRLAELMGGRVGVRSDFGVGSTFWVVVPMESQAQQPHFNPIGAGRRVLIVEDIAEGRDYLATQLRRYSFETVTAAGADDALERLSDGAAVDLVICDELMPGKSGLDLLNVLRADPRTAALPFILLTLFGSHHDVDRWLHKPDAVAAKPARGWKLAGLAHRVLCGESPGVPSLPEARSTLPNFKGRHILLVDDNPVNQRVAVRALQKMSAEVTIANNGAEALERIAQSRFDAVLMDCQMPVMDGFTAAARIREQERAAGGTRRLPVIALSANVMREDRERCLAAGMDAHLGKPFDSLQLADCLSRFVTMNAVPGGLDMNALRKLTGGDLEFERELLQTFVDSGDQCLAAIVAALEQQDFETVGTRAHALKGASANIHALPLSTAASELEIAARTNPAADLHGLLTTVQKRYDEVTAQLAKVS